MKDETLRKLCRNIPTEKFDVVKNTLGINSLLSVLVTVFNNMPVIDFSFLTIYMLNYFMCFSLVNYRAIDFTKSYVDLEKEQQLFLQNYKKFMQTLDLKTLGNLCGAFYFLYKNGYLSIDGIYKARQKSFFEGRRFQLANIFNGCGVCRHQAGSLKNILNFCGYPAASLSIYTMVYEEYSEEDIKNIRESIYNMFKDISMSESERTVLVDSFLKLEVVSHQLSVNNECNKDNLDESKKTLYRTFGNHLAVITTDGTDKVVYDQTYDCFYQFKDNNSCDIINEEGERVQYRLRNIKHDNTPSEEKILYKNLKLHPMNLEGLREQQDEAVKRLEDNLDIVEKFRENNLSLMISLRDKAYKIS